MLPFSLRVAWLSLSVTGLINCWVAFFTFCRVAGSYWPLYYCLGCTLTQGIFCMGMLFKMNPTLMSPNFCLTQLFGLSIGIYIMTGTVATMAACTTYASYKPKTWRTGRKGIMIWRPLYIFTIYVFPVVCAGLQVAFTAGFDQGGRKDGLFCDYSDPVWMRFLSYAGLPWLLTIPIFYLSITSLLRIRRTNDHMERSREPDIDLTAFTAPPPRRPRVARLARSSSLSSQSRGRPSSQISNSTLADNMCYYPSGVPTTLSLDTRRTSNSSLQDTIDSQSRHSSSFPTFAQMGRVRSNSDRISVSSIPEDLKDPRRPEAYLKNADSHHWPGEKVDIKYGPIQEGSEGDDLPGTSSHPVRRFTQSRSSRKKLPELPRDIYWVIYFQIAFAILQCISSISSIVDSARGGVTPFGSQNVALLLWAWSPTIFLVHLSNAQKRYWAMLPWRRKTYI